MDKKTQGKETLETRLAKHPGLREQVECLLQEVENAHGRLVTADEAEDAVVERLRKMGREALESWARQRQQALGATRNPGERQGGKKNSAG